MAMSRESMVSASSTARPSSLALRWVGTDVATQRIARCLAASAGSRNATVEPVPRPTVMPVSTSAAAACAASCFSWSMLTGPVFPIPWHGTIGPMQSKNHQPTRRPDDHVIVIFGATGDLAKRKLLPGLFHLAKSGLLPAGYQVIGTAPHDCIMTDDEFRAHAKQACTQFGLAKPNGAAWKEFESRVHFACSDDFNPKPLVDAVHAAEQEIGNHPKRIFHLAVPPSAFGSVIGMLGATKLSDNASVIIEKPFGYDLESSRKLGGIVHSVFSEDHVFRIDHFLGKESVENILAFRFANGLFEPIWNRDHISHVQIDVPEL